MKAEIYFELSILGAMTFLIFLASVGKKITVLLSCDNIGLADFKYVLHLTETIGKVCGFMYDINAQKWGKIF